MSPHIDIESLEDLARGEPVANAALVAEHVGACEACRHELAWLRKERALFEGRAEAAPPVEQLWRGVAEKLARPAARPEAPYRVNALPAQLPVKPRPTRWWMLAAALFAVGSMAALGAWMIKIAPSNWGEHTALLGVPAGVTLVVRTSSADVRVEPGLGGHLRATTRDREVIPTLIALDAQRYELRFAQGETPREAVRIEVAPGTSVDVTTSSGDVTIGAIGGAAKVLTSSGEVEVALVSGLDVTTTSGDVSVRSVSGPVRVNTSSGDISVGQRGPAGAVLLASTSGAVTWSGLCGEGCTVNARSNSGDVRLSLARASGAVLSFESSSGELHDGLHTAVVPGQAGTVRRVGAGGGAITVNSTSGDLVLSEAN